MTEHVDATVNEDAVGASADSQSPQAGDEEESTEEVVVDTETKRMNSPLPTTAAVVMEAETVDEESSSEGAEVQETAEEPTAEILEATAVQDAVVDSASEAEGPRGLPVVVDVVVEEPAGPRELPTVTEPDDAVVEEVVAETIAVEAIGAAPKGLPAPQRAPDDGGDDSSAGDSSTAAGPRGLPRPEGFRLPEAEDAGAQRAPQDDSKRVVRMLAVGQQINGVVKRTTEFGAFVDIGVGRDGLIHISELSSRRVAKVSDVLSKNQEIRPWIKKLDRKRNRISLTLIDPEMKTIRDLKTGEIVQGTVTRILPYGAFVDIGIGRDALLHVREMSNGFVEKPEDVVQAGETIEARIIELSRRRGRVDLSLKGLRDKPEPEPEPAPEVAEGPRGLPAEEGVEEGPRGLPDQFEDVEVLSPMELAFKKAVEAEGAEIQVNKKKRGKRDRRRKARTIQDEIVSRTLDTARK